MVLFYVCQSCSFYLFFLEKNHAVEREGFSSHCCLALCCNYKVRWPAHDIRAGVKLYPPASLNTSLDMLSMVHLCCQLNGMENHHGNTLLGVFTWVSQKKNSCLMEKPHSNYESQHPIGWDPGLMIKIEKAWWVPALTPLCSLMAVVWPVAFFSSPCAFSTARDCAL